MNTIRFGRTNVQVPAISLGTWGHGGPNVSGDSPVGWTGHNDELAAQALVAAREYGITHWDTADVYGNGRAEQLIGAQWDKVPRSEIFLATKVGWDKGEFDHYYHPQLIRRRMDRSLRNLRVETVDLYYLHHCDFGDNDEYFDDALAAVLQLRSEGKFRFLGLSDWNASKIMRFIERVDPDVVQPYRNVVDDDYVSSGLRDYVDAHDLGVAFFSPIKHGLLLGKYDRPTSFEEGDFRSSVDDFQNAIAIQRYKNASDALRERFSSHPEPVLHGVLGALLSDAPTATILLGQRNPKQVIAAAQVGQALSKAEAEWVRKQYGGAKK